MLQTLRRRWFLLLLMTTLVVGMGWAVKLAPLAEGLPREWIIGSVLLAMALPLRIDAMWATLRRPAPALLAVAINFVVVPLLAWGASLLLTGDLALGLIIAAAVPCTLASAAVWTRLAGGNDAVSLLVTMITNLSCFLVTPALIQLFAGQADHSIQFADMAWKLFLLIVFPIFTAQLLRSIPRVGPHVGQWATANKHGLSTFAQVGILTIVFVGAVNGGLKIASLDNQLAPIAGQIFLMILLAAAVHTVAWWIGYKTSRHFGMTPGDQLAVAFAGSQKTLMVGLAIALPFGGLTVLPMLVYHVEQLLIDTLLAERFRISVELDRE
ncbi:MAG: bile acid:sodium symporter family protein [Planctomycetes bacterium]|nr:bile acid:sodium symporter family protein [Planctomycetota bacterium]